MKKMILIVKSTYYEDISKELYENALKNIRKMSYDTYSVPGVFEIPALISKKIKDYNGVIALGCVIKGETPHFDFISKATIDGIMKLSIDHQKPIGNGIITCLNKKQAIARSKTKGAEAADAVFKFFQEEIK